MRQTLHSYTEGYCDDTRYGRILKEICPVPKKNELWDYDSRECRLTFNVFDDNIENIIFQKEEYINLAKACETAKSLAVSCCMHPYA